MCTHPSSPRVITQVETTAEPKIKPPLARGQEQDKLDNLFLVVADGTNPTACNLFVVGLLAATLTLVLLIPCLVVKVLTPVKGRLGYNLGYL